MAYCKHRHGLVTILPDNSTTAFILRMDTGRKSGVAAKMIYGSGAYRGPDHRSRDTRVSFLRCPRFQYREVLGVLPVYRLTEQTLIIRLARS